MNFGLLINNLISCRDGVKVLFIILPSLLKKGIFKLKALILEKEEKKSNRVNTFKGFLVFICKNSINILRLQVEFDLS